MIGRLLEQALQDDLQLIGQHLERRHGATVLRYHVQPVPRAAGVLEEIRAGRRRPVHRRQQTRRCSQMLMIFFFALRFLGDYIVILFVFNEW